MDTVTAEPPTQSPETPSPSKAMTPPVTRAKPIDQLSPQHRQAMALKFAGKTYKEIGAELKLIPDTVKNWFTSRGILSEAYPQYVESVLHPKVTVEATVSGSIGIAEALKNASPKALQNIIKLGDGATNEAVKLSANKDILDRAGYMPVQKMIQVHAVEEMSVGELDSFVQGVLGKSETRAISVPPIYKEADSIPSPSLDTVETRDDIDAPDDSDAGDGDHTTPEGV